MGNICSYNRRREIESKRKDKSLKKNNLIKEEKEIIEEEIDIMERNEKDIVQKRLKKERVEKEKERLQKKRLEKKIERIEQKNKEQERTSSKFEKEKNDSSDKDYDVSDEIKRNDIMAPYEIINKEKKAIHQLWKKTLEKHNEFRKKHRIENLELNETLCEIAQSRAEKYSKTDLEKLYMIPPNLYKGDIVGENIAIIDNYDDINFEDIINKWYEEKQKYDFNSNNYIENTGHFTQLIWKETKEVGFGHKKSFNGKMYFIAIYYPAGNIFRQFKNNVLEEQDDE